MKVNKQGPKIGLIGQQGVGKTHILNEYLHKRIPQNPASTIAVEFATTIYTMRDGTSVKVQLWDTAGHQKYKQIVCVHLRDADGIVFVYDIRNKRSFDQITKWMQKVDKECSAKVKLMIFGNKLDLIERDPQSRRVTKLQAEQLAYKHNATFHQTSVFIPSNFLEEILLAKQRQALQMRLSQPASNQSYCNACIFF